jgi:alpha-tubulin suppressor-like RCC1 family protein
MERTPPSGTFESVSAGFYHTCGVTNSGSVECWGRNGYGQVSNVPN